MSFLREGAVIFILISLMSFASFADDEQTVVSAKTETEALETAQVNENAQPDEATAHEGCDPILVDMDEALELTQNVTKATKKINQCLGDLDQDPATNIVIDTIYTINENYINFPIKSPEDYDKAKLKRGQEFKDFFDILSGDYDFKDKESLTDKEKYFILKKAAILGESIEKDSSASELLKVANRELKDDDDDLKLYKAKVVATLASKAQLFNHAASVGLLLNQKPQIESPTELDHPSFTASEGSKRSEILRKVLFKKDLTKEDLDFTRKKYEKYSKDMLKALDFTPNPNGEKEILNNVLASGNGDTFIQMLRTNDPESYSPATSQEMMRRNIARTLKQAFALDVKDNPNKYRSNYNAPVNPSEETYLKSISSGALKIGPLSFKMNNQNYNSFMGGGRFDAKKVKPDLIFAPHLKDSQTKKMKGKKQYIYNPDKKKSEKVHKITDLSRGFFPQSFHELKLLHNDYDIYNDQYDLNQNSTEGKNCGKFGIIFQKEDEMTSAPLKLLSDEAQSKRKEAIAALFPDGALDTQLEQEAQAAIKENQEEKAAKAAEAEKKENQTLPADWPKSVDAVSAKQSLTGDNFSYKCSPEIDLSDVSFPELSKEQRENFPASAKLADIVQEFKSDKKLSSSQQEEFFETLLDNGFDIYWDSPDMAITIPGIGEVTKENIDELLLDNENIPEYVYEDVYDQLYSECPSYAELDGDEPFECLHNQTNSTYNVSLKIRYEEDDLSEFEEKVFTDEILGKNECELGEKSSIADFFKKNPGPRYLQKGDPNPLSAVDPRILQALEYSKDYLAPEGARQLRNPAMQMFGGGIAPF